MPIEAYKPSMNTPNTKRYIVTGGSGFIGTNLIQSLIDKGETVVNLDIAKPRNVDHLSYWQECDLRDRQQLTDAIRRNLPTHLFHLGARTDLLGTELADYSANVEGVANLVEACRTATTLEKILFASSRLVCEIGYEPKSYEDYLPTTVYGHSKVEGEKYLKSLDDQQWKWAIFRPTSIWGPWFDIPYRTFFESVRTNRYIHPKGLQVRKSFGYVGNAVFQIECLMDSDDANGKTYYVGDYIPIDVLEFANQIATKFSARKIPEVPLTFLKMLAATGDVLSKVWSTPPITSFRLNNLLTDMIHDFTEISKITGPLPYTCSEGIARTVDWMIAHDRRS